jgi:hypothetical protein
MRMRRMRRMRMRMRRRRIEWPPSFQVHAKLLASVLTQINVRMSSCAPAKLAAEK